MKVILNLNEEQLRKLRSMIGDGYDYEDAEDVADAVKTLIDVMVD